MWTFIIKKYFGQSRNFLDTTTLLTVTMPDGYPLFGDLPRKCPIGNGPMLGRQQIYDYGGTGGRCSHRGPHMNRSDKIDLRFVELESQGNAMRVLQRSGPPCFDPTEWHQWGMNVLNLLLRVFGESSPQYSSFKR